MQFVRYERNGALRLGALDGDTVVDLLDAAPNGTTPQMLAAFSDMTLLIAAGTAGLEIVRKAVKKASPAARTLLAKARLRAPIAPSLILCSGENYWDHREEKPEVTRKDPEFFLKTGLGVIATGDDIVRDERVTQKLDYETEMLIVIGKPGRHIPAARAHEHIYGYSVMNDVTARDRQVTLRPAMTGPVSVLTMARSAEVTIVVGSVSVLLPGTGSVTGPSRCLPRPQRLVSWASTAWAAAVDDAGF